MRFRLVCSSYVVTVFANEAPPSGVAEVVPKMLTPATYGDKGTTPLKFTVAAGSNTIDLPLIGEPPN